MSVQGVARANVAELALRAFALRGTAVYSAYLVPSDEIDAALAELGEELVALDPSIEVATLKPRDGEQLVVEISAATTEIVLADARSFVAQDWALLDPTAFEVSWFEATYSLARR